jgi:hypothetical protein
MPKTPAMPEPIVGSLHDGLVESNCNREKQILTIGAA